MIRHMVRVRFILCLVFELVLGLEKRVRIMVRVRINIMVKVRVGDRNRFFVMVKFKF